MKYRLKNEKQLDRKEMRKHNIDIILASTAIADSATLIGMDKIYLEIQKFFPNLLLENWMDQ